MMGGRSSGVRWLCGVCVGVHVMGGMEGCGVRQHNGLNGFMCKDQTQVDGLITHHLHTYLGDGFPVTAPNGEETSRTAPQVAIRRPRVRPG